MSDPVEELRADMDRRQVGRCACSGKCVNPETGERNTAFCPSTIAYREEWRRRYPEALRKKYAK